MPGNSKRSAAGHYNKTKALRARIPENAEKKERALTLFASSGFSSPFAILVLSRTFWNNEGIWNYVKDESGINGQTRLMWCASFGLLSRLQWLLNGKAVVNAVTAYGCSALFFAAQSNSLPVVRELLKRGADANARIFLRVNAQELPSVFHKMHPDYIGLCKENGDIIPLHFNSREVKIYMKDYDKEYTGGISCASAADFAMPCLLAAVLRGYLEVARALLEYGANANLRAGRFCPFQFFEGMGSPRFGMWSPLDLAIALDRREIAQLLVSRGADLMEFSKYGRKLPEWLDPNPSSAPAAAAPAAAAPAQSEREHGLYSLYKRLDDVRPPKFWNAARELPLWVSASSTALSPKKESGYLADSCIRRMVQVGMLNANIMNCKQ